jgi:uncharacterized protein YqgQ
MMGKPTRVVWGEYDELALIKDEHGNLYEWRILETWKKRQFAECSHIMGLAKMERNDAS